VPTLVVFCERAVTAQHKIASTAIIDRITVFDVLNDEYIGIALLLTANYSK
jgi:hypothetical protein